MKKTYHDGNIIETHENIVFISRRKRVTVNQIESRCRKKETRLSPGSDDEIIPQPDSGALLRVKAAPQPLYSSTLCCLLFTISLFSFMSTSEASCPDGSLPQQCSFLLSCLLRGGSPHSRCGGGYIYTCCEPPDFPPPPSPPAALSPRSHDPHRHRRRFPPYLRDIDNGFPPSPPRRPPTPPPHLFAPPGGSSSSSNPFSPGDPHLPHSTHSSPPSLPIDLHLSSPSSSSHFARRHRTSEKNNEIYYNEPECGVRPPPPTNMISKRIIGGDQAAFAELPWQAHIRIGGFQCGGVLVNRYFVVTAAHCVHKSPLARITIHLGEFDTKDGHYEPYPAESYAVLEKRTHPKFKYMLTQPDRFDVAVLRLSRPATYRPNIRPICLPPPGEHPEGHMGVVAGWGKTDNSYGKTGTNILRKAKVPIIRNSLCLDWHHKKSIDVQLRYEMFCAGYPSGQSDACLGDSGGPLVVMSKGRWTLAGVTSAGFGCAVDFQPGIYHKIAVTSGWIAANIKP